MSKDALTCETCGHEWAIHLPKCAYRIEVAGEYGKYPAFVQFTCLCDEKAPSILEAMK